MVASGGMPSSHSSMCCAVTASVALLLGLKSALFPACLAFTLIVMYDAANVRYHAGIQAEVREGGMERGGGEEGMGREKQSTA